LKQDEYTYRVAGPDRTVSIEVRSSIGQDGKSAPTGKDSIRAWLVDAKDGKPLGSKVSRWITRKVGWQERLRETLRTLWLWRLRAGDCPQCQKPKGIWKVKKESANKGRPFAKCCHCGNGFVWLDEKPAVKIYFASELSKDCDLANDSPSETPLCSEDESAKNGAGVQTPAPKGLDFLSDTSVNIIQDEPEPKPELRPAQSPAHELNPEQLAAVTAPVNAAVRVLAPPGSGKTTVLSYRYAYLLENGAKPEDILAVTFNRNMADELLQRIIRVNPSVRGTAAEHQVCTIHAACLRMLKAAGDTRHVPKTWKMKKALQEIAERLWPYADDRPGWTEIDSWIAEAKFHNVTSANDLDFFMDRLGGYHGRNLHEARRRFDQAMYQQNALTFADMLFDTEQKLERDRAFKAIWQKRYKWLLIDEGQDTNAQAMRILSVLAKPQNQVALVGDSDQLLYRFAGATPEANLFDGFEQRYPDGTLIKLSINYRSTITIINTCQRLIAQNYADAGGPYDQKYLKDMVARPGAPEGQPVTFQMYDTPEAEAVALVENLLEAMAPCPDCGGTGQVTELATSDPGSLAKFQCFRCLDRPQREPGDFFVGARTRAQLGYLEGPLTRAKIPFINIAGGSFWGSKHVADVVAYLALAYNESNDKAFARVYNIGSRWNTYPWGKHEGEYCSHRFLGKAFLSACQGKYGKMHYADRNSFQPGIEDLVSFVHELQANLTDGPAAVLRVVVDDCYRRYLEAEEGIRSSDEAENGKLSDLETVIDVAGQFENVGEFLDYVRGAIKAAEAAKDKDWSEHVVISTIHRLKGQESEVVYGIGFCEGFSTGTVPSPAGLLPHTFSMTSPPQNGVLPGSGMGRVADERCCAYVLVSRAKSKCHLSGVRQYRKASMDRSRFIDELGIETKEESDDESKSS
jgi:DNA helicase-2/ATP-dependent DNA helicase PcrA